VVVISGAARGRGRSHAVTLAREGASLVEFDICERLPTVLTPGATEADRDKTRPLVEQDGWRRLSAKVDARDLSAPQELADLTMQEFGRVDILLVNHRLWRVARTSLELTEDDWDETIEVMLTGHWKVCKAFAPKIIEGDRGGSIVFIASANGFTVQPGAADYCRSGSRRRASHARAGLGTRESSHPREYDQPGDHGHSDGAGRRYRRKSDQASS
jgi:(+)-trans-carveol dehydrogenase